MTTVRDVLFSSRTDSGTGTEGKRELGNSLAGANVLPAVLAKAVPMDEVCEAIWQVLDLPLGEIVFGAWDQHQLVRQAKTNTAGTNPARLSA